MNTLKSLKQRTTKSNKLDNLHSKMRVKDKVQILPCSVAHSTKILDL